MNLWLAALPVYNEVKYVDEVLNEVVRNADRVLVIDDGSTDGTAAVLDRRSDIAVIRHTINRGYGAALKTAFQYTLDQGFDGLVTLDCDGQHQPRRIPQFIDAAKQADIVSGSRYLQVFDDDDAPPEERLLINRRITAELNHRLGLQLTDAFCGFKAYRRDALRKLSISEPGYAMPLEVWVQAAAADLRIVELPVELIYLDLERSFGGSLDDSQRRLAHYYELIERSLRRIGEPCASECDR